jgi:hypothetical protein
MYGYRLSSEHRQIHEHQAYLRQNMRLEQGKNMFINARWKQLARWQ